MRQRSCRVRQVEYQGRAGKPCSRVRRGFHSPQRPGVNVESCETGQRADALTRRSLNQPRMPVGKKKTIRMKRSPKSSRAHILSFNVEFDYEFCTVLVFHVYRSVKLILSDGLYQFKPQAIGLLQIEPFWYSNTIIGYG